MANTNSSGSFVYAIKSFAQLADVSMAAVSKIKAAFTSNPYGCIIIRSSAAMDKAAADQVVFDSQGSAKFGNNYYTLVALAGTPPGSVAAARAGSDAYVYAVKEFTTLSGITQAELNKIKGDFGQEKYMCLLIRNSSLMSDVKANSRVTGNPTISVAGDDYGQGSLKGTPPGSTDSLDTMLAEKTNKRRKVRVADETATNSYVYVVNGFNQLSDITAATLSKIEADFDTNVTFVIVRVSAAMDKAVADEIVFNYPTAIFNGVSYSQGAIAGIPPGTSATGNAYVYAIREFPKMSDLTGAELDKIKTDIGADRYAGILIRNSVALSKADADQQANDNPTVTVNGDDYDQGSVKGTPPGSTDALDMETMDDKKKVA